jgi:acetoin utilization protein AcuB
VETDDGRLLGLISSQMLLEFIESRETLESLCAADLMEREPPTVTPDTPIEEAVSLMIARNRTCLPVLDHQKLVGILTDRDCLKIVRSLLYGS